MAVVKIVTTIEDVRAAKPEMIFYGANTCWWTHRGEDLRRTGGGKMSLPCDPRGGMLMQTDDGNPHRSAAARRTRHALPACRESR